MPNSTHNSPPINLFEEALFYLDAQDADGFVEALKKVTGGVGCLTKINDNISLALRMFFSFVLNAPPKPRTCFHSNS